MLFFCLFQYFEEKEYQTESKRNETFGSVIFGTNVIQRTWSASQEAIEEATRVDGAPFPGGRAPCLVGPSGVHRRTSSSNIYLQTPKTSRSTTKHNFHHRNLLYPRDPILEPLSALPPEGESTMEGLYIISKASLMSCEEFTTDLRVHSY